MGKKILITGSTGFVGRHLLPKILNEGHQVLEISRSISKSTDYFKDKTNKLNIDDEDSTEKIIEFNPEIAIHLASYLTESDQLNDIEKLIDVNILFLSKVLNAVRKTELKLFINTGTFAEYHKGDDELLPAYFYAATKTASRAIVDYYANAYNFKQITIVPFTIYGGNDSQKKIIDIIFDSINSDIPLDLSPGDQVLDFIHVDDVTDFYILLVNNEEVIRSKSIYKIGTGKGHNLKQVADLIEVITKQKTNINWGGKSYRKSDIMFAVADIKFQKNEFCWRPKITLIEGIKKLKRL